jgi:hypothetical protein
VVGGAARARVFFFVTSPRLKNSLCVATRYDKLIESFAAFVIMATTRIWIGFVHTT